jgi:hypothetical protein
MREFIVKHVLRLRNELLEIEVEHSILKNSSIPSQQIAAGQFKDKILPALQKTALSIISDAAFSSGNEDILSHETRERIGTMFKVIATRLLAPFPLYVPYIYI